MVRDIGRAPKKNFFTKHPNDTSRKDDADYYTRFINESTHEKIAKLDRIGNADEKAPSKMHVFQSDVRKDPKVTAASSTKDETELLIMRLENEYERMQEKLLYQELMFQRTKDELEKKQKQILDMKKPHAGHAE